MTARNANGTGASGVPVAVTPFSVPDAPDAPTVTPGDGSATVQWTAPFDGGRSITSYRVERRVAGGEWTGVGTTDGDVRRTVDRGLENGTPVAYRVVAANQGGPSAPSAATLATPRTVPGVPTDLVATPRDRSVQLNWTAPTDDGGDAVSGYRVEQQSDDGWTTVDRLDGTTTTIHELDNGTSYAFRVSAVNEAGVGSASAIATTTPRTVPGRTHGLRGTPGDGTVDLAWTAPSDAGGAAVTGYAVEQLDASGDWTMVTTTTAPHATLAPLSNGATLTYRVRATNDAGTGPASERVVVVPRTVPDAPTDLVVAPGDRSATLTWTRPEWNGGASIDGYDVERAIGDGAWEHVGTVTDATTTTVGLLTNGTPTRFRVAATNVAGTGSASGVAITTPRSVADAPTGLTAIPGDGQVALTWSAPSWNGGSAVTGYVVQSRATGDPSWLDVGPATGPALAVDDLANGRAVSFRVQAVNEAGRGAVSETVTTTPRRSPDEPRSLSAVPGDRAVSLQWSAPSSDGGAAVGAYLVQVAEADGSWGAPRRVAGTSTTIDGLDNGSAYGFRVAAENAAGTGTWSAVVRSTPFVFAPTFTDETGASVVGKTLTVGDTVVFTADHLPVGAEVGLELHSTVRVLATGTVGDDGTIRLATTIPTDIEAGSHHLVATIDGVGSTIAPVEVAIRLVAAPAPTATSRPVPAAGDTTHTAGTTPPVVTRPALAFTGVAGVVPTAVGALVTLLTGLALAVAARLRRRRDGRP